MSRDGRRPRATGVVAALATFAVLLLAVGMFEWALDGDATAFDSTSATIGSDTTPNVATSTTEPPPTVAPAVRMTPTVPAPSTTTTAAPLTPEVARAELAARRVAGGPALVPSAPDPTLLRAGGAWFLYATGTRGSLLQVWRSIDLVSWQRLAAPLAALPAWSSKQGGATWAPAVVPLADGTYAMYYTTRHAATRAQCIGIATASEPAGPFLDVSTEPLVCQYSLGGSIDPSVFIDTDGSRVLLWKSDGNCCAQRTQLWSQRLGDDGRSLVGRPVGLLRDDQAWEGGIVEAPSMWVVDGVHHLVYSANRWDTDQYGIGQAICESAAGPCRKQPAGDRRSRLGGARSLRAVRNWSTWTASCGSCTTSGPRGAWVRAAGVPC